VLIHPADSGKPEIPRSAITYPAGEKRPARAVRVEGGKCVCVCGGKVRESRGGGGPSVMLEDLIP